MVISTYVRNKRSFFFFLPAIPDGSSPYGELCIPLFFFLLVNTRQISTTTHAEAMKTSTLHERTVEAVAG